MQEMTVATMATKSQMVSLVQTICDFSLNALADTIPIMAADMEEEGDMMSEADEYVQLCHLLVLISH